MYVKSLPLRLKPLLYRPFIVLFRNSYDFFGEIVDVRSGHSPVSPFCTGSITSVLLEFLTCGRSPGIKKIGFKLQQHRMSERGSFCPSWAYFILGRRGGEGKGGEGWGGGRGFPRPAKGLCGSLIEGAVEQGSFDKLKAEPKCAPPNRDYLSLNTQIRNFTPALLLLSSIYCSHMWVWRRRLKRDTSSNRERRLLCTARNQSGRSSRSRCCFYCCRRC